MISQYLATALKEAGLAWNPGGHDRFVIPERDLDGDVFSINDLSIEVQQLAGHPAIMFNGTVEWALDWIHTGEVIWLPTEEQLRNALGDRFIALEATGDGFRCVVRVDASEEHFAAETAVDAYGYALLACLERPA